MNRFASIICLAAVALILNSIPAFAQSAADFQVLEKQIQDLQAKVNKLQKEQADSTVNYSGSAANSAAAAIDTSKLLLSVGVTQLKLYGDVRFRYQYDQFHPEVNVPNLATDERNRFRFRLRIGADVQLGDQFFAGVMFVTSPNSDADSQTFTEGYDNYSIYIDKAFAGWTPNDWFTIVVGKQANPFYTTELVWAPAINPAGIVETLDISKALFPANSPLSLQLISMQGAFEDNSGFTTGNDSAWQFVEQLKATWHFNKDTSVTFAPGYMTYTSASLTGLLNAQPFTKTSDVLTAANSVQTQTVTTNTRTEVITYGTNGVPSITVTPVNTTTTTTVTNPATGASRTVSTQTTNNQTQINVPKGTPGYNFATNKALAGQKITHTVTVGGGPLTVTTPTGQAPASESRDLSILTAPGDVSFKLAGISMKVYWDFAFNADGSSRSSREYLLSNHNPQDDFAWLAGYQIGNNIHKGDWSLFANYRQVGLDSIDPNINYSYFALSYLNVQGVEIGAAYNFTNSVVGAVTYYDAWNLRQGITGGEATGGAQLANGKAVQVLQVDMNVKF